jgi:nuclear pore complex protein Nup93
LLTHQFEKAIDHLHKEKKLQLEAIHFAIALAYHGLIRMTPYDKAGTRTLGKGIFITAHE